MKLEQKFPEKRAFITGAASGLGLALCQRLAARGWKLLIADINAQRLDQAEQRLLSMGAETIKVVLDVTDRDALFAAANVMVRDWGGVDLVFNNAGIATAGAIDELSHEDWRRTVDIDLWSVIDGPTTAEPGEEVTIRVTYGNNSSLAPGAAAVNLEFPPGLFMADDDDTEFFVGDTLGNTAGLFLSRDCDRKLIQVAGPDDTTPGLDLAGGETGFFETSFAMPAEALFLFIMRSRRGTGAGVPPR